MVGFIDVSLGGNVGVEAVLDEFASDRGYFSGIEVKEYSKDQGCYHLCSLAFHIEVNIKYPYNQYFIVGLSEEFSSNFIPIGILLKWSKYIRVGVVIGESLPKVIK